MSAQYHNISICQGRPNLADGNCAFESIIFNINDRLCFSESLPFSPDYYRRMWITDFKNRTVNDKTWNIYSPQQWEEGWTEMMESQVYERGLFGDLMLFAIACGVRKVLLIFNTNLNSPHDPIYVCDPRKFGIEPSTPVPVLLAYDMSHYESMHPMTTSDIERTCELVDQYVMGNYGFGKNDLLFLLNIDAMDERVTPGDASVDAPQDLYGTQHVQIFEDNLPEHLQGKRPKDMDPEEKREYNNFKKKKSRKNENKDHADIRKKKDAESKERIREKETASASERIERNASKAKAQSDKRAKETVLERKETNLAKAKSTAAKRAKETLENKKERNASKSKAEATKRAKETATERKARNVAKAKADAAKRAKETLEKKKERNASQSKAAANKRAKETAAQRKERNSAKATAEAAKRAKEILNDTKQQKHQRALQRARKIPPSQYFARNAQKVLIGAQIVPE